MRCRTRWRAVPTLVVLSLLAVACSRVPPGGELVVGDGAPTAPGSTTGIPGASEIVPTDDDAGDAPTDSGAAGGLAGSTATTDGTSTRGGGDVATSSGTGATSGESTDDGTTDTAEPDSATAGPGPGIDGRTIKIVYSDHFEDCPEDLNEPRDDVRQKGKKVIEEYVKFFNEYVLAEFNWQFDVTIVDDGGYFCPERQRATALQIAEELQPFAVLGTNESAQGPILADIVTRAGILHVGNNWTTREGESARHPYAWNVFPIAELSLQFLIDWMAVRIAGTTVEDRVTGTGQQVPRVYGVLGVDDASGKLLAEATRRAMVDRDLEVVGVYLTSADAGVTAQQAPTTIAEMKSDGVNTLVFGVAAGGNWPLPFTNAMDAQNYYPDVMVGTSGNSFFDQLWNKDVWEHAQGTSYFPSVALRVEVDDTGSPHPDFQEINENSNAFRKAWTKLGHTDNPQNGSYPAAFGTWANLSLLATGIIHAGDTLNAHTFAQGLETAGTVGSPNRCTVGRLMGRDYPWVPSYDWNAAHDGGARGWTTIYWVNQPNGISSGYYESSDNYVYFQRASDLSQTPSHDTGQQDYDIPKQERIGLEPWLSCSQFPNYPS